MQGNGSAKDAKREGGQYGHRREKGKGKRNWRWIDGLESSRSKKNLFAGVRKENFCRRQRGFAEGRASGGLEDGRDGLEDDLSRGRVVALDGPVLVLSPLAHSRRSFEELYVFRGNDQYRPGWMIRETAGPGLTFLAPYFLIKLGCSCSKSAGLDSNGFSISPSPVAFVAQRVRDGEVRTM